MRTNKHTQNGLASYNYTTLGGIRNSAKYKRAVKKIAPKTLYIVLETLVIGGPGFRDQIVNIILNAIGSGCLRNHFNGAQLAKIVEGNPSNWDAVLLYKVVQRVCGLAPMNSRIWFENRRGEATLENLIYRMKQLHVDVRHNFDERILSDVELEALLEELQTLSVMIFDGLVGFAVDTGREFDIEKIENAKLSVDAVIDDVKQAIIDQ